MTDTTQITNDNNTLSHVSAQLNPLNITITELKKGTVNLPTINNNPSFSQPLPTFTSKSKISRPILSIHNTVTEIPLLHRVLFGRQTKHQQHNTIHRQIKKANMSNWCQAVEELMDKYRDDIHTPEFLPVDQRMQQSCQKMTR